MPVIKKNGQVRIYINFRDLNRACPKDDFPLPHIDLLIDNTVVYEILSFMDDFLGYNQIRLAEEDQDKNFFHYSLGYLLLCGHALRPEKCWSNLSTRYDGNLSWHDTH